jgi:ribosome-associated toxin RatA of RatAB toxin-antitoxin module
LEKAVINEFASDLDSNSPIDAEGLETELENLAGVADSAQLQAVEVEAEAVEGRKRKISAKIYIPRPVEQVWQVLTDYEALADFIPNLGKSDRLEHPQGGIRLEQVGTQRLLRFNFSARVVLDLEEIFLQEIRFHMVEGDFNAYEGSWRLEPQTTANQSGTNLSYTVLVWPKRTMPVVILERRLQHDLRLNLSAIRQRVETLFG